MNEGTSPRMNDERRLRQPFSKGVEAMTDAEQKVADAVARAFETLSERLSRELSGAFNQMAQQIGRVQKQQLEIVDLVSRQAGQYALARRSGTGTLSATTNTPALSSSYRRPR
jgi:hypothetical protein